MLAAGWSVKSMPYCRSI